MPDVLGALAPRIFGFGERIGLVDDRRVWRVMELAYGERTFADARIPPRYHRCDLSNLLLYKNEKFLRAVEMMARIATEVETGISFHAYPATEPSDSHALSESAAAVARMPSAVMVRLLRLRLSEMNSKNRVAAS